MPYSWIPEGLDIGRQFGPKIPEWLRQPQQQMPSQGMAQPLGSGQTPGQSSAQSPWMQPTQSRLPGWGSTFGQIQQPQVLRGFENPWAGAGSNAKDTPIGHGANALLAADIAGMFNPNVDPLMDRIRQQAFMDNGGRQNALRLGAQIQGGGDPYLQAFAALQGQMQGQSDLSRLLGGAQLARGSEREKFFQDLLMQMLGGAYGVQGASAGRAKDGGFNWGSLLGGLGGAAVGSIFGPAGTAAGAGAGAAV